MAAVIVLTSVPDVKSARRLSRLLVNERLAACVTSLPGATSVYRWKGRLESARETLLWIKTARSRIKGLQKSFKEHHPYDLPEFLVLPVSGGSRGYLSWLEEGVDLSGLEPLASSLRTRGSTN